MSRLEDLRIAIKSIHRLAELIEADIKKEAGMSEKCKYDAGDHCTAPEMPPDAKCKECRLDIQYYHMMVCSIPGFLTGNKANARLIAAAPELVEACWDAISQIEYLHEKFSPTRSGEAVLSRLRAAIAKAGAECQ